MLIFLTGASGAGKTSLLKAFQQQSACKDIPCLFFDSIGVPTEAEMIAQYGSGEAWQKAMTEYWIDRIFHEYQNKKWVLLEGQTNLTFIIEACKKKQIIDYKIILVHCSNEIRHKRLAENRRQSELVNTAMDNWADFLKAQAIASNSTILDTSNLDTQQTVEWLKQYLEIN